MRFLKPAIRYSIFAICFVLVCYLLLGPPVVTIKNESGKNVNSIVLSGTGFTKRVASLASNGSVSVVVSPSGDSGLQIDFSVDGKTHKTEDLAYLQESGGYCATIRINADYTVTSKTGIWSIFCPRLERVIPYLAG